MLVYVGLKRAKVLCDLGAQLLAMAFLQGFGERCLSRSRGIDSRRLHLLQKVGIDRQADRFTAGIWVKQIGIQGYIPLKHPCTIAVTSPI